MRLRAWGAGGPWEGRRGFDSLVQAACGIADALATDAGPGALPAQALDHGTGHLTASAALRALARRRAEGGVWVAELSLAQTAHWLLAAPPADPEPPADPDVARHLVELPAPGGPLTVVAPPGSPVWRSGLTEVDRPSWLPRQGAVP